MHCNEIVITFPLIDSLDRKKHFYPGGRIPKISVRGEAGDECFGDETIFKIQDITRPLDHMLRKL